GEAQPVVPAHQAPGLDQAGRAQRCLADEQARTEADANGKLVGLGLQDRPKVYRCRPESHASAALEIEPREQYRINGGAEDSIALSQRVGERACRVERDLAIERIGSVDRLEFNERGLSICGAHHGPHGGGDGGAAVLLQEFAFGCAGLPRHQGERHIAAKNDASLARKAIAEAVREGADARNRRNAKCDAGNEHRKAAQAAAHLAQRETPGERARRTIRRKRTHSMRPERSRTTRSQRCASAASWVTSTSVVLRVSCPANKSSMISRPVASSRLPVGSSATRIAGCGASARAIATRCWSPPD